MKYQPIQPAEPLTETHLDALHQDERPTFNIAGPQPPVPTPTRTMEQTTPSYSQKILSLPSPELPFTSENGDFQAGHDDGCRLMRTQAAEIASCADAEIRELKLGVKMLQERWSDLATTIRTHGPYENYGYCIATARRCQQILDGLSVSERRKKDLIDLASEVKEL